MNEDKSCIENGVNVSPLSLHTIFGFSAYAFVFILCLWLIVYYGTSEWSIYVGRIWIFYVYLLVLSACKWFPSPIPRTIAIVCSMTITLLALSKVTYGVRGNEFSTEVVNDIPVIIACFVTLLIHLAVNKTACFIFRK